MVPAYGLDPLPTYVPVPKPAEHPFCLVTGARIPTALHSRLHGVPWLRQLRPTPLCEMHPSDADTLGLEEILPVSDVIITTGGVSVGDVDYMRQVLEDWGARILFWKLAMKPGGAMIAASKDGKVILGLSGNPGAAMLGLMRIAQPFLRRLCGRRDYALSPITVRLREPLNKESFRLRLLRGRLLIEDGQAWLTRPDSQGPGDLSSLMGCDLIGEIPAGSGPVEAGTLIRACLY